MVDLRLGGAAKRKKLDCELLSDQTIDSLPSWLCGGRQGFLPGLVLRRIVEQIIETSAVGAAG